MKKVTFYNDKTPKIREGKLQAALANCTGKCHFVDGALPKSPDNSFALATAFIDVFAGKIDELSVFISSAEALGDATRLAANELIKLSESFNISIYISIDPADYVGYRPEIRTSKTTPATPIEEVHYRWSQLSSLDRSRLPYFFEKAALIKSIGTRRARYLSNEEQSFMDALIKAYVGQD